MSCGRPLSKGKVDERANESGTHSAVRHGTSSSLYRCESISSASPIALATAARRALGHVGWISCTARYGVRADPGYSKDQAFRGGGVGSGAECGRPDSTLAIFDTYRIRASYVGEIGAGRPIRPPPNAVLGSMRALADCSTHSRRLVSTQSTFATRPCAVRFPSSFRSTSQSRSLG